MMNELRTVRRLRPEIEPLDDARCELIWSEIAGRSTTSNTPPADSDEIEPALVFSLTTAPDRTRQPILAIAAAVIAVVGLGAVIAVRSLDNTDDQSAPAAQPSATSPVGASQPSDPPSEQASTQASDPTSFPSSTTPRTD